MHKQQPKTNTNLTNLEGRTVDEKIVTSSVFRGGAPVLLSNRRVLDHNYNLNYVSSFSRYKGTHSFITYSHLNILMLKLTYDVSQN